jgi:hypothetical protein
MAMAAAFIGTPAQAALLDHGPGDATLTWPTWYRDLNRQALQLCRSTAQSPNPAGGVGNMCFPLGADPACFAGNLGMEIFYNDTTATLGGRGTFFVKYLASLEASYLATTPTRGQETVFSRIRIVISATVPGTYKVTHPFGVEIFPDVQPGPRAVFFTNDITAIPGNFDAALAGTMGPFLQWDQLLPGESLTAANGEQFLGDPNYAHTFTGSPFGTNFVRVDGPVGSNLDGAGNDFIQSPLASVLGQKFLAAIPSPLRINRATYSRDPVKNLNTVDVFASSTPGAKLLLTGTDMPSLQMKGDAAGNYFAHIEYPATVALAGGISVTNVTDVPPTTVTALLKDLVNVSSATFDTLTNTLKVTATSSDLSVPPPALAVEGPLGGPMTAGVFSAALLPGVLPPAKVSIISAAGGLDADDVVIVPGLPMNPLTPPVAVADVILTNSNTAATVSLSANDTPAAPASLVIVQVPTNGTVAVSAVTPGTVTYTPAANFSGADNFSYVITDATGAVSNLATVAVTVAFTPASPTANPDNWSQTALPKTVSVIANDTATAGTTLDPASVVIGTLPLHGTATPTLTGSVTYTPAAGFLGTDTFTYTVKNNFGVVSNPATVSVFVSGAVEVLAITKALYTVNKGKWNIVGTTSIFGVGLTPSVTCYVGTGTAGPVIGSAPIDVTGKFAVVPVVAPPPDVTNRFTCVSTNGGSVTFTVTRN